MQSIEQLRDALRRIDGRGYKAYKQIAGRYDAGTFTLHIDHVQGDPFAAPSRVRAVIAAESADFSAELYRDRPRRVALADYVARICAAQCERYSRSRGSGGSGRIAIDEPGQQVLARTAVLIHPDGGVELRLTAGLPAAGRRVSGRQAEQVLCEDIPRIAAASGFLAALDGDRLWDHVRCVEDTRALRQQLDDADLVAFVGEGAHLPRRSGIDDRPMEGESVVTFEPPESLTVSCSLPHRGVVRGMGIPRGVTLIVGGGYHGKSTLLSALELGIYDHLRGDGRELVVSDPATVKIRAEDGRRVERVDISPFIANLPFGRDTVAFCSDDASGSTSQAANVVEALEAGARVLLVDEDTAATNFMVRDERMQRLIAKESEPITPFVDKVRQLYDELGVSTVVVMGGCGDYFDVADTVIGMDAYRPRDLTGQAKAIASERASHRRAEGGERYGRRTPRVVARGCLDATTRRGKVKLGCRALDELRFGDQTIDLSAVEQLVAHSQLEAIARALHHAGEHHADGKRTLAELLDALERDVERGGLDALDRSPRGNYAEFRRFELAAAINRLRTLRIAA